MKKQSKILVSFLCLAFIMSLVVAPVSSFAKGDEGRGKANKQEKQERKELKKESKQDKKEEKEAKKSEKNNKNGCLTQFGHFIAPGWIKHNGERLIDEDCHLPFGIWKKIGGGNGISTSTAPTPVVLPVISAIDSLTSKSAALIQWTTNTKTDSKVLYSLNSPVDLTSSSTKSVSSNSRVKNHQIYINGLTANTTYRGILVSRDAEGNTATSSEITFTTKNVVGDTTAPVISSIIPTVSTSTLKVSWNTNENATGKVYYGTTPSIDANSSTTLFVDNTTLQTGHTITISGLASSTTYYYILESIDLSANVRRTAVRKATTNAQPAPVVDATAPIISSVIATINSTALGFTWNTNENATTKAYYSTSTPVNFSTSTTPYIQNVSLVSGHALTISGLATSTTYHVILESKDASNNPARTSEISLTTTSRI